MMMRNYLLAKFALVLLLLLNCLSMRHNTVIWKQSTRATAVLQAIANIGPVIPSWKDGKSFEGASFQKLDVPNSTRLEKISFPMSTDLNDSAIIALAGQLNGRSSRFEEYENRNFELSVPPNLHETKPLTPADSVIGISPELTNASSDTSTNMFGLFSFVASATRSWVINPASSAFGAVGGYISSTLATPRKPEENALSTFNNEVYVPKGLIGVATRLIRRRILNILDRSPTNWANALSQDVDPSLKNMPAIYVSKPGQRRAMNQYALTVIEQGGEASADWRKKGGRFHRVRNVLSSIRSGIAKRISWDQANDVDDQFNIFGGLTLTQKEEKEITRKSNRSKAAEILKSASLWLRRLSILRSDSSASTTNISLQLRSPAGSSAFPSRLPTYADSFPLPSQEKANPASPFHLNALNFNIGEAIGGMIGNTVSKLSGLQSEAMSWLQSNQQQSMPSSRQPKPVPSPSGDEKEVMATTFRNLVQAGIEIADASKSTIIDSLETAAFKREQQAQQASTKKESQRIRWPWEVYYRSEIPFFETGVGAVDAVVDTDIEKDVALVSDGRAVLMPDPQFPPANTQEYATSSNVAIPTTSSETKIKSSFTLRNLFPFTAFIMGALASFVSLPFHSKKEGLAERAALGTSNAVIRESGHKKGPKLTRSEEDIDLDNLEYSPSAGNNVPFPLLTGAATAPDSDQYMLTSNDVPPRSNSIEVAVSGNTPTPSLPSALPNLNTKISSNAIVGNTLNSVGDTSLRNIAGSIFTSATAQIFSIAAGAMNDVADLLQSQQRQQQMQSQPSVMIQSSSIPSVHPPQATQTLSEGRSAIVSSPVGMFLPPDFESEGTGKRTQEVLRTKPAFIDKNRGPLPTKADFSYIKARQALVAVQAALNVKSEADVNAFLRDIGIKPLLNAMLEETPAFPLTDKIDKIDVVKGVCRLTREKKSVADEVSLNHAFIGALCDFMEAPLKRFHLFQSQVERDRNLVAQKEAVALVQRMVRSSDFAVNHLRNNTQLYLRIMKCLDQIIEQESLAAFRLKQQKKKSPSTKQAFDEELISLTAKSSLSPVSGAKKKRNSTTIVEYNNLKISQMARVASWGLGGVQWRPRVSGQKGLRILSLDGGGTRGVLSISYLKEIFKQSGTNKEPYELFDIICGTSTGGIIAVMLGSQRLRLLETEAMYDRFIDRVFGQKSNLKLVTEQAFYDETELENVLYEIVKDDLMLDSNQNDCSRVFCISTKVNNNPPQTKLWRNYNYPPGQSSRYPGAFRVNTLTAVRATTAAPTFFTPVQWEGGLFCDGALVANNPTAVALQEAKVLYPGIPVELVVSIGTGYINMGGSYLQSMGWDLLVNNLIASSTDTEDVHALLVDFLPKDKYFRFNPVLRSNLAIDEKNKSILTELKQLARDDFRAQLNGPDGPYLQQLFNLLKGDGT